MLKKLLPIVLVLTLLLSSAPLNIAKAADTEESFEDILTEEMNSEGIDPEGLELNATEEGLEASIDVAFDEGDLDTSTITETENLPINEIDSANVVVDINLDEGNVTLYSTYFDEDGTEYTKEYDILLKHGDEESVKATFVDTETGEEFHYDSEELSASWAFLIPVGINIGRAALTALFAAGAAVTVGGVAYISYKEFKKKKKTYDHYAAHVQKGKTDLFIGHGLSRKQAVSRLKSEKDTWSNTKTRAQSITKSASPIGKIVGAEEHRKGKHYHYHPAKKKVNGKYTRLDCHAFYGGPK
jgi:hypothetical protein